MAFTRTPWFWLLISVVAILVFEALAGLFFSLQLRLPLAAVTPWLPAHYYVDYGHLPQVRQALMLGHGGALCLMALLAFWVFKPAAKKLHGNMTLATVRDLRRASPCLLGEQGILLGQYRGRYVIQAGQQSAMLCAPTRTGKGTGVVIPNLLSWQGSVVVTDIKKENFRLTGGFHARHGQKVFLFDPLATDYRSHRWNPLAYISDDVHLRMKDIQKLALYVLPTPPGAEPIWASGGRELFSGVVLFLLDVGGLPVTIGEVYRQLMTEQESSEYFRWAIETHRESLSASCIGLLSDFCNAPHKQREGIKKTLTTAISLWKEPILDAATAANDFDFRNLRKQRMSIYVAISPGDIGILSPILSLFFQQLVDVNTREIPDTAKEPQSVLLLMDEFPAMGRLQTIVDAAAFIAGYGLRLLTIAQSKEQISTLYGQDQADNYRKNHATVVHYAPKEMRDAEVVSNELGTTTTVSSSHSLPRGFGRGWGSKTQSEAKRPLLLPQEVKALGQARAIVVSENCPPAIIEKIVYFKDPNFFNRCVPKKNRRRARQSTIQAEFMKCVHPPPVIPSLTMASHPVRGGRGSVKPLSVEDAFGGCSSPLNPVDIDRAANQFIASLAQISQ